MVRVAIIITLWTVLLLSVVGAPSASAEPWPRLRAELIDKIEAEIRATAVLTGVERLNQRVTGALGRVPRHEFVPTSQQRSAYKNRPLPIGHGQTISQPYIVALMTELLTPERDDVVLEIGTGSGYQAAVLAELVRKVYTIEIVDALAASAKRTLERQGYDNVEVKHADGYYGWPEHEPFDSIIVTAAGTQIPPPLLDQLRPGGKMVLPIGGRFTAQHLVLVTKRLDGTFTTQQVLPVQFVPFTREP